MDYSLTSIDEIKPYENNPRNNQPAIEAVAQSLLNFGWRQPIVVDKNNVIVAGHTRYLAAQKLLDETGDEKWKQIPVHTAIDLTDDQITAYRLADNKTAELAIWDDMKLEGELAKLAETELDMSLFGFDTDGEDNNQIYVEDFFDRGVEVKEKEEKHGVKVQCNSEAEAQNLRDRLQQEGYICTVIG